MDAPIHGIHNGTLFDDAFISYKHFSNCLEFIFTMLHKSIILLLLLCRAITLKIYDAEIWPEHTFGSVDYNN